MPHSCQRSSGGRATLELEQTNRRSSSTSATGRHASGSASSADAVDGPELASALNAVPQPAAATAAQAAQSKSTGTQALTRARACWTSRGTLATGSTKEGQSNAGERHGPPVVTPRHQTLEVVDPRQAAPEAPLFHPAERRWQTPLEETISRFPAIESTETPRDSHAPPSTKSLAFVFAQSRQGRASPVVDNLPRPVLNKAGPTVPSTGSGQQDSLQRSGTTLGMEQRTPASRKLDTSAMASVNRRIAMGRKELARHRASALLHPCPKGRSPAKAWRASPKKRALVLRTAAGRKHAVASEPHLARQEHNMGAEMQAHQHM